jgi:hypothetical protein
MMCLGCLRKKLMVLDLGIVVYVHSPALGSFQKEDGEFEASLDYRTRPYHKTSGFGTVVDLNEFVSSPFT